MNGKGAKSDRALARLADRQHGVVSVGQLRLVGIGEDAVFARARAGRLHRAHRGVYGVGHSVLSDEARWMAAVLAVAGVPDDADGRGKSVLAHWGAALSYRDAACLWGLLKPREGLVDISVPGNGGRRRRKGIRLHRSLTLLPASVTLCRRIPVTTPARTIEDLRRVVAKDGRPGLISPKELRRAIRQANFFGLQIDEEATRDRTRSDLERDFLRLCRRHRLPVPEVNVHIGPHLVDFLWRDRMVVVETDGYIYHRGRAAFEDDRARDLALRGLGYEVVRLADRQLTEEPDRIAGVLEACLARFPSNRPEKRQAAP